MQPFTTDLGTLGLLESLTPAGRQVLYGFLRTCNGMRPYSPTESATLGGIHFTRSDIERMHLERKHDPRHHKILATTDFTTGARWRRGSLRMPNTEVPATVMSAIKGRLIEEVVKGAPVNGYRITQAVHDRSAAGTTLRLRCEGEAQGLVPYEAAKWT